MSTTTFEALLPPSSETEAQVALLTAFDRLLSKLFGCFTHTWSFPYSEPRAATSLRYPRGFNAHQHCISCGVERFYNTSSFEPGKQFKRLPRNVHPA